MLLKLHEFLAFDSIDNKSKNREMDSFTYHLYSSYAKKEKTELEKAFKDLIMKVELYEKQYSLTLKLYLSEWKREDNELKERYDIEIEKAGKIYDELYDEAKDEDEQARHSYASQLSNLDFLSYQLDLEKDNIKTWYQDFFDLYSKSILVALYSLIETKLKQICDIASIDFDKKLKYEDLVGKDYLKSSINYFNLVIQIPTESLDPFITKLTDIQFIRNRIIHSESKFSKENQDTINVIVKKNKGLVEMTNEGAHRVLKIKKPTYILNYFELIRELFEELIWLLDSHQENKILRKGLEYWFGLLDSGIFIKNITTQKGTKGKRNIEFTLSSRKRNIPRFTCKVTLARSSENSLEIIDQTENKAIGEFNQIVNSRKYFLFEYVFELFNLHKTGIKLDVMMFEKQ